jgi:tetratricopeptide (TPR) repeat protein
VNALILVVDDEPDVEVLFRQQFRRDLRADRFTMEQGNLADALTSYQASLGITERLAKSDPGNADWQRDLSISYEKIGNVQVAQGTPANALTSYQASLGIRERLAKSDPSNVIWQRDLVRSYSRLASVYLNSKQVSQAQQSLAAGREILFQLIAKNPKPPLEWQQGLAWFDRQIAALEN